MLLKWSDSQSQIYFAITTKILRVECKYEKLERMWKVDKINLQWELSNL